MLVLFFILLFVVLSLYDIQKSVVLLFVMNVFFGSFSFWGFSLMAFLLIVQMLFFFIKYPNSIKCISAMPFKTAVISFTISLLCTNLLSQMRTIPNMLFLFCFYFVLLFILIFFFKKEPASFVRSLEYVSVIYAIVIVCYTFFELFTGLNPFIEMMIPREDHVAQTFISEVRFGLKRCQSFFSMHTTLGGVAYNVAAVLIVFYKTSSKNKIMLCLIVLLGIVVFVTGARSCILSFCILCLMLIPSLDRKTMLLVFLVGIVFASEYFLEIVNAFINTDKIDGSNSDMRMTQLFISLSYFGQSPIWGNGSGFLFTKIVSEGLDLELAGAESMWFNVLADYGILGVIAEIVIFVSCIVYSVRKRNKSVVFYVIGYFVMHTMSSVPGVQYELILVYTFVLNAVMDYYKKISKVLSVRCKILKECQ